jgi:hypothetical protein
MVKLIALIWSAITRKATASLQLPPVEGELTAFALYFLPAIFSVAAMVPLKISVS